MKGVPNMPNESIIEALYKKMVQEDEPSTEYNKERRKNIELRDELESTLNEEQKEQLNILIESRLVMEDIECKDYFSKGFKIAVKIMTEVFYKEDT